MEDIKALIANYVEDAVCGVQLPRIDGEKEWGTYAMMGLGIKVRVKLSLSEGLPALI